MIKAFTGTVAGLTGLIGIGVIKRARGNREKIRRSLNPPEELVTEGSSVSVIIPSYREEDYLPDTLQTIRNQTYYPLEIIVADSSPLPDSDRIQGICRQYKAKYVYVPPGNISAARNRGAAEASGDIFLFLDADCWPANDYVEQMVYALEGDVHLAHGVDPTIGGGIYEALTIIGRQMFKPRYRTSRGMAIRAGSFREMGAFDETCDIFEGCREDLTLGDSVINEFGAGSIAIVKSAFIGTSPRREQAFGLSSTWSVRGVRNGKFV